ncbi:MAG: hypothetical protein QGG24_08005, partial [Vicinamibacterales bacterium]|nr:hypothetical protein [Vicinamibacterales bacterium]
MMMRRTGWSRREWLAGTAAAFGAGCAPAGEAPAPFADADVGDAGESAVALPEFEPRSMLHVSETRVEQPRFPVIDVHTHLGRYRDYSKNLTAKGLVEWMDANNVERSVVLPLVSPESTTFLQPPEKVLAECKE